MADSPQRRPGSHFSDNTSPEDSRSQGTVPRGTSTPSHRGGGVPTMRASKPVMQTLTTPRSRSQRKQAARGTQIPHIHLIGMGIVVCLILAVVGVLVVPRVFGGSKKSEEALSNQGSQVEVVIPDGSGAQAIGSALQDAGVIRSSSDFVTELKRQKADVSLKSGTYMFAVGQTYDDIIKRLQQGPNSQSGQVKIPEGLTVAQIAAIVESSLHISAQDFINQAKASNYSDTYSFLQNAYSDSLEGFLFPKTYDFSGKSDVSADVVIRAMLDQYARSVDALDFSSAATSISSRYGLTMNEYDMLKLASIVEREAVTQDQRSKVASTFYNRMQKNMPLQSDATMMYVTGGKVGADDLKQQSPYNTYLNTGLTPTPICVPSLASIKAVLEPADTDYLYFYITQTDELFSATYDEHLQAIEKNRGNGTSQ